jgi:hypothetical protein
VLDVGGGGGGDDRAVRIGAQWREMRGAAVDGDEVGALARRQASGDGVQATGAGTLDRRELDRSRGESEG